MSKHVKQPKRPKASKQRRERLLEDGQVMIAGLSLVADVLEHQGMNAIRRAVLNAQALIKSLLDELGSER